MKKVLIALMLGCLLPLQMQGMFTVFGRIAAGAVKVGNSTGILPEQYVRPEDCLFPTDTTSEAWGLPKSSHPATSSNVKSDVSAVAAGAGSESIQQLTKINDTINERLTSLIDRITPHLDNESKKPRLQTLQNIATTMQSNVTTFNGYVDMYETNISKEMKDLLQTRLTNQFSYAPREEDLHMLEKGVNDILNQTDLDINSHILQSQNYCTEKFPKFSAVIPKIVGYPLGVTSYVKTLTIPQENSDLLVGAVGAAATCGGASLLSKNNGSLTQAACLGLGFAGGVALKRILGQSLSKDLQYLTISRLDDSTQRKDESLKNIKEALYTRNSNHEIGARVESVENKANQRHEVVIARVDAAVDAAQNAENVAIATNLALDGVSRDVNNLRSDIDAHNLEMQNKLRDIEAGQIRLEKANEVANNSLNQLNQILSALNQKFTVSHEQLKDWFLNEGQARDQFERNVLNKLEQGQKIQILTYLQVQESLFLQRVQAQAAGFNVKQISAEVYGSNLNMQQIMPAAIAVPTRAIAYTGPKHLPIKSQKLLKSERDQQAHKIIMSKWKTSREHDTSNNRMYTENSEVQNAAATVIQQKFRLHNKFKAASISGLEELS